jgi:hypothetical protein
VDELAGDDPVGVTETHRYDMHGNGRISKVLDSEIGNVFIASLYP